MPTMDRLIRNPRAVMRAALPLPPPSADISSLDRLSLDQDDALREAVEPHLKAIQGKNAPVAANPDPTAGSAS